MKDYPCSYACHKIGCTKTCEKYLAVRNANFAEAEEEARKAGRLQEKPMAKNDREMLDRILAQGMKK